jgi:uncharacterized protein (DUF486 family)
MQLFIIYCLLTFSACLFHLFGTYYFLDSIPSQTFLSLMITSISLNAIATVIRVPSNKFLGKGLSVVYMEMLYVFLLFIALMLYSLYIRHEPVHLHTYIIAGLMFGLFILNDYLTQNTSLANL